jgi:uroporphyrinogen-III synthase
VTADAARRAGLRVDIIADEYTARGLLEAIVRHRRTATLT